MLIFQTCCAFDIEAVRFYSVLMNILFCAQNTTTPPPKKLKKKKREKKKKRAVAFTK